MTDTTSNKFQIADITNCYAYIRDAIEGKQKHFDYAPEEVYFLCRSGQATLLVCPVGFCIVQISNGTFWVLVAYSEEGNAIRDYLEELETLAKESGARSIAFATKRKGYSKLEQFKNWKTTTTYEKVL